MLDSFYRFFLIAFVLLTLLITIFFFPFLPQSSTSFKTSTYELYDSGFIWPAPGYTRINSYFGKRTSPTAGASSYHKGIDIGAPQGAKLVAIADGSISFADFFGGGGYTITLTHEDFKITYCHIDPNFLVSLGEEVKQGQVIALVGPKYVTGVKNNPYHDATRKSYQWSNNWTTSPSWYSKKQPILRSPFLFCKRKQKRRRESYLFF